MSGERLDSLYPVVGQDPQLLILGSMPGSDSLKFQQYYAHWRNFFWPIIYTIMGLDRDPWEDEYERRLEELRSHGIALWDSLSSCLRKGSLDQHISDHIPNEIGKLVEAHPTIRMICCNGGASYKYFRSYAKGEREDISDSHFLWRGSIAVYKLPSTSPVPSKNFRNLDDRLRVWEGIIQTG